MAVALALLSSLLWGVSDLLAGIRTRTSNALFVAVVSHAVGLGLLLVVALGRALLEGPVSMSMGAVLTALASGVFAAGAIAFYYRAMSMGLISLASPLLAAGAVVAFVLAVTSGERASSTAWLGALLVLLGAVVTATDTRKAAPNSQDGIVQALIAAGCLGFYLLLLGNASNQLGGMDAALLSRASSLIVLVGAITLLRLRHHVGSRSLRVLVAIGTLNLGALLLYSTAADIGLVSVSSVLASLYPVVTIVLARIFAAERLRLGQAAGISMIMIGIGLVTVG